MAGWRKTYAGLIPASMLDGMSTQPAGHLIHRLAKQSPDRTTLVAEFDGNVVGFVNAGRYRVDQKPGELTDEGEIRAVYVDPEQWSRGAGLALMTEAVRWLRDSGYTPIRLWVLVDNPRARRFYERFGFRADGAASQFTIDDVALDEIRYTLD